jgi:hypothetical protein
MRRDGGRIERIDIGYRRSSAGADDALLHGDVGAVQLLRDARAAHPVLSRSRSRWRSGIQRGHGCVDLRHLHVRCVCYRHSGRMDRRSLSGTVQGSPVRRNSDHRGPFQHGAAGDVLLLHWPRSHHHWHRPAQDQRLDHGWVALRRRRSAPRWRVLHLLHGHQHRRVPGTADYRHDWSVCRLTMASRRPGSA